MDRPSVIRRNYYWNAPTALKAYATEQNGLDNQVMTASENHMHELDQH
jgi:hypothetical protein